MEVLDRRSALGLGLAAATGLALLPKYVAAQTSGDEWEIHLSIYRNLRNREVGEPDDGPMAWDAHRKRRQAVHEVLSDPAYDVRSWGETDDTVRPHEVVTIIVIVSRRIGTALVPFIAEVVGDALKDMAKDKIKDAIQVTAGLLSNLYSQKQAKQIGDFSLELPDGSRIRVGLDGGITVVWANRKVLSYPPDWKPTPSP
jgi:hypothetical protein